MNGVNAERSITPTIWIHWSSIRHEYLKNCIVEVKKIVLSTNLLYLLNAVSHITYLRSPFNSHRRNIHKGVRNLLTRISPAFAMAKATCTQQWDKKICVLYEMTQKVMIVRQRGSFYFLYRWVIRIRSPALSLLPIKVRAHQLLLLAWCNSL